MNDHDDAVNSLKEAGYTASPAAPKPAPAARPRLETALFVIGASVAAFMGTRALKPKPAPEPVPPAPPAEPSAPAAPAEEASAPAAVLSDAPRGESHLFLPSSPSKAAPAGAVALAASVVSAQVPAWARATPSQEWTWPAGLRHVGATTGLGKSGAPESARRLVSWHPENPGDGSAVFAVKDANGNDRRCSAAECDQIAADAAAAAAGAQAPAAQAIALAGAPGKTMARKDYDEMLKKVRAAELQTVVKQNGAVSATGYLTKDGRPMATLTYADGHHQTVAYDPLAFDLRGHGVKTSARKVLFDLYGYGRTDKIQGMNDIDEDTGVLVFDASRTGKAGKDGREVLGDRTSLEGGLPDGFKDGFAALRGLVEKGVRERVLGADVAETGVLDEKALRALEKAYGLKMRVGGMHGRTVSLAEAGVRGISLSRRPTQMIDDFDGRGNGLMVQPGAVFLRADGTTGSYMNIWLAAKAGELGLERVSLR